MGKRAKQDHTDARAKLDFMKIGDGRWYVLASRKPLQAVIVSPLYAALVEMAA